eukprot:227323-Chlamydomonas_euryale.AAC.1
MGSGAEGLEGLGSRGPGGVGEQRAWRGSAIQGCGRHAYCHALLQGYPAGEFAQHEAHAGRLSSRPMPEESWNPFLTLQRLKGRACRIAGRRNCWQPVPASSLHLP